MNEDIIGRPLMGRVMHGGSLKAFRQGKAADSVCASVLCVASLRNPPHKPTARRTAWIV